MVQAYIKNVKQINKLLEIQLYVVFKFPRETTTEIFFCYTGNKQNYQQHCRTRQYYNHQTQ